MDKNNLPSNDNSSLYTLPDIELDPANHEDLWNTHSATFHATVDFFDPVQQTPGSPASENSPWTLPEAWLSDTALASDSPQAEYHTLPLLSELPPIPTIPSPPSIYLTFDTDPESFSPSFTLDLPGSAKTSYIDLPPAVPFNLQPRVPSASPSPVSGSTSSSPLTSLSSLDSSSSEALSSPDITITPARRKQPKRLAAAKRPCRESTADTSPTGIITFQLDVNSPDGVCPTQAREPDLAEIRRRCKCPGGQSQKPHRHWRLACPSNPTRSQGAFTCKICQTKIGRLDNYKRHMKDHHPGMRYSIG